MTKANPGKRCMICGGEVSGRLHGFVFCYEHTKLWFDSKERLRVLAFGGGPASLCAIEDFIRRIKAEDLNGSSEKPAQGAA